MIEKEQWVVSKYTLKLIIWISELNSNITLLKRRVNLREFKNQRYAWEKPSGDSKLLGIGEK